MYYELICFKAKVSLVSCCHICYLCSVDQRETTEV